MDKMAGSHRPIFLFQTIHSLNNHRRDQHWVLSWTADGCIEILLIVESLFLSAAFSSLLS